MIKHIPSLVLGFLLLILSYYFVKIKTGKFILKRTLLGKVSKVIAPKKGSKTYEEKNDKLIKALSQFDVMDITALKTSAIIVMFLVVIILLKVSCTFTDLLLYLTFLILVPFMFDSIISIFLNRKILHVDAESIRIMNLLTMALSINPIPINTVIIMALDNSKYLKKMYKKFFIAYMVNSEEAYKLYLVKTKNKSFENLIGMLNHLENSDKCKALRNIKTQNEKFLLLKKIELENIKKKKDERAFLTLIIVISLFIAFLINFGDIHLIM